MSKGVEGAHAYVPPTRSGGNTSLHGSMKRKNDEYYTLYDDVVSELSHYDGEFRGASVYLPCDGEDSAFWRYFADGFDRLHLSRLVATHHETGDGVPSVASEMVRCVDRASSEVRHWELRGNGDFRTDECVGIMDSCDVVVTNPPFSLTKEFIPLVMSHGKRLLCISNKNAITFEGIFKHVMQGELWLGHTTPDMFVTPDGDVVDTVKGMSRWYASFGKRPHRELSLTKAYHGHESEYPHYDGIDAIEVSRTKDIPVDYDGVMGVPITFMDYYDPDRFEILGKYDGRSVTDVNLGTPVIHGRQRYKRIAIRFRRS